MIGTAGTTRHVGTSFPPSARRHDGHHRGRCHSLTALPPFCLEPLDTKDTYGTIMYSLVLSEPNNRNPEGTK
jgi:hypothetical protein